MAHWGPPPWSAPPYPQPHPHVYVPGPQYANWWTRPEAYGGRPPPAPVRSKQYPNLNPILAADTTLLRFDIKKKPRTEILASTYYSNRSLPARATPVTNMRLISKSFPWTIDIVSPDNITCEVVWDALYSALQQPIVDSEWGFIIRDGKMKETVENAVKKRLTADGGKGDKHYKRIDFLGDETIFKGLEKDDEHEKAMVLPLSQGVTETWVVKLSS